MIMKTRVIVVFLSVCLLCGMTSCSKEGALPTETDLPVEEPTISDEDPPKDIKSDTETKPKEYNNYFEAYLDILKENSPAINDPIVGDSKIAIMDVFEDETPELLYIYNVYNTDEYLRIFTYSETEGIKSVFDDKVYSAAGGGDNYCVYLDHDAKLKAYYSSNNLDSFYGFWSIVSLSVQEQEEIRKLPSYYYFNNCDDKAQVLYVVWEGETIYTEYGNKISKAQFDKIAKDIMSSIDRVLFQSKEIPLGYGLYEREDLWKNITPFEAECVTYDEAVSWLEEQIENFESK